MRRAVQRIASSAATSRGSSGRCSTSVMGCGSRARSPAARVISTTQGLRRRRTRRGTWSAPRRARRRAGDARPPRGAWGAGGRAMSRGGHPHSRARSSAKSATTACAVASSTSRSASRRSRQPQCARTVLSARARDQAPSRRGERRLARLRELDHRGAELQHRRATELIRDRVEPRVVREREGVAPHDLRLVLGAARVGERVAAREHGALALLQRRLTAADEAHCRLIHALHLELRGAHSRADRHPRAVPSERVRWYCESTTATPSASKSTAGRRRRVCGERWTRMMRRESPCEGVSC